HQTASRLAQPRALPCARRGAGPLAAGARARRPARSRVARGIRGVSASVPGARRRVRAPAGRPRAGRLGRRAASGHGRGRAGRPPIRLAALSGLPVIYVFSHDSIGLGEDGPTHQPIEQLAGLRAVPNLVVIRPADPAETVEAWRAAILRREGPVALVLTRQKVAALDRTKYAPANGLRLGGYVLADAPGGKPSLVLIATGSEVELAL